MTSLRQIESNRRNAQRSTGPKTQSGKARSSQNAVRHGLTAETVIGPLEDPVDYQAFEQPVTTGYDAETTVERELVLRLASLLWRLRRATSVETGLLQIQCEANTASDPESPKLPGEAARLSTSSSPVAMRVDRSSRAAFFVWPTSITEFSNDLAATRRHSGARSDKPYSRCSICGGARPSGVIGEHPIAGNDLLWDCCMEWTRPSARLVRLAQAATLAPDTEIFPQGFVRSASREKVR